MEQNAGPGCWPRRLAPLPEGPMGVLEGPMGVLEAPSPALGGGLPNSTPQLPLA